MFLNTPVGLLISACDRQKITTKNSFISMVINFVLNLILIPIYDIKGAAIASLTSFTILFLLNFFEARKIIDLSVKYLVKNILKILVACILMSVIILFLKGITNFIVAGLIGSACYFIFIELFGVYGMKEIIRLIFKK